MGVCLSATNQFPGHTETGQPWAPPRHRTGYTTHARAAPTARSTQDMQKGKTLDTGRRALGGIGGLGGRGRDGGEGQRFRGHRAPASTSNHRIETYSLTAPTHVLAPHALAQSRSAEAPRLSGRKKGTRKAEPTHVRALGGKEVVPSQWTTNRRGGHRKPHPTKRIR